MKKFILSISMIIFLNGSLNAQNSIFDWVLQYGGDSNERGTAIELDSQGNFYCTGEVSDTTYFIDTTFVANFGDIFIAKFSSEGELLWVRTCGGTGLDRGLDLKIDNDDNAVITGFFSGSAVFGDTTLVSTDHHDLFIAKYSSIGNLIWVVQGAGLGIDEGLCLATNSTNDIFIGGFFESTLNIGSFNLSTGNTEALFLAKLDPTGNVIWAKQTIMGEFGLAAINDIIIDPSGDIIFTGYFHRETTFQNITLFSYDDSDDIFVAKYNSNGIKIWVKQFGGDNDDNGNGIDVDESGNIYLVGEFRSTATFDAFSLTSTDNNSDLFIGKIDPAGNFIWINQGSGAQSDIAFSVSYNQINGLTICGSYSSDFSIGDSTFNSGATYDAFVAVFSPSGDFNSAISIGENGEEAGWDIFLNDNNYAYLIGHFSDTIWFDDYSMVSHHLADVYITKINLDKISNVETEYLNTDQSENKLFQNYPNPFKSSTKISFVITENGHTSLIVYDILGNEVTTLVNGKKVAGEYELEFDAKGLPAGIYYYQLRGENYLQTIKMIINK